MSSNFDRSSVLKGAVLVTLSTYINYASGLVASILVARALGSHDYGQYAYFVWLAGTLTSLYCGGVTFSAMRFVADELGSGNVEGARRVQALLRRWFVVAVILVSVAYAAASRWLLPADWHQSIALFVTLVLVAAATKAAYLFGASISKGHGRFDIDANTTNLMSLVNIAGVVALVVLHGSLNAYLMFFVALCVGHALLVRRLMRRANIAPSRAELDPELKSRIAKHCLWSALLFVVAAFSNKSFENVLLNWYIGPEAVAWFAIAAAMSRGGTDMLAAGLSSVLMPVMSHAFGSKDRERAYRIFSDAVRYYFFLGLLLSGIGYLWAEPVILVLYGEQYQPAVLGLQVMMLVGGLTLFDGAAASILTTTDNQSARVVIAVVTLVLTCATAVILIPRYGFVGALITHSVSRIAYFTASVGAAVWLLDCRLPLRELLRAVVAASVGAIIAALVLAFWSGDVAEVVAGALYVMGALAGSVLFRVWTKNDLKLVAVAADRLPILRKLEVWLSTHTRAR